MAATRNGARTKEKSAPTIAKTMVRMAVQKHAVRKLISPKYISATTATMMMAVVPKPAKAEEVL